MSSPSKTWQTEIAESLHTSNVWLSLLGLGWGLGAGVNISLSEQREGGGT